MLSFSLVAEALTGLTYHRPSGENSKFLPSPLVALVRVELQLDQEGVLWVWAPPPTSDFFQSWTSTCQGSGLHWPPFPGISGVGHSGSWPPLHCRDSTNLAPEVVPGTSLRSGALSPECGGAPGDWRWLGRLDMWEPGLGDYCGRLLMGCLGDDTWAPASATWLGGV